MKKSVIFLAILFCAASLGANAQDKKISEKNVAGQQANQAVMMKHKIDIERQYNDYLKKQAAAESAAADLRRRIEEAVKTMESDNKMGNFEIQRLMSEFNQAETLHSQVVKKREEAKKAVVGKL